VRVIDVRRPILRNEVTHAPDRQRQQRGEGTNHLQPKGKNNMNKVKNKTEEPKAAPMYQNQVRLVGFLGKDPEQYENRTILSLVAALRTDQAGNSSFQEFLAASWPAG
jgi:hypothetical protein